MNVKTESKLLLSALAAAPGGAGIVLVASGEAVAYGWLLIGLSLVFMIWLWKPWEWLRKSSEHK